MTSVPALSQEQWRTKNEIQDEGARACQEGDLKMANPYNTTTQKWEHACWNAGWTYAWVNRRR